MTRFRATVRSRTIDAPTPLASTAWFHIPVGLTVYTLKGVLLHGTGIGVCPKRIPVWIADGVSVIHLFGPGK